MRRKRIKKPKLIVIVGPTASGKTSWSLRMAKKINGAIISADSRQIYKKMDIGTAKEKGEWRRVGLKKEYFVDGIKHYLVDFVDPGQQFTAVDWRDKAFKYIKLCYKNKQPPIVVGGTGLYLSALVDNYSIPKIPANKKLRESLSEKSAVELYHRLETLDTETAAVIDKNNKRRLIRALEVSILSGEPYSMQRLKGEPSFDCLKIGIEVEREELHSRIEARVDNMIKIGLMEEVKALIRQGYAWSLPSMSGIGYKQFKEYLENKITREEVAANLKRDTKRYAKRQMTWFSRDKSIKWCRNYEQAEKLALDFVRIPHS